MAKQGNEVATSASDTKPNIDDPALLAQQAREAIDKNATDLRKSRVPIATEPPTVYRP